MGLYGSPDTYPYHTRPGAQKPSEPPKPPKPPRKNLLFLFWFIAAVCALILLAITGFTTVNVFAVGLLYSAAYAAVHFVLWLVRNLMGKETRGLFKRFAVGFVLFLFCGVMLGTINNENASAQQNSVAQHDTVQAPETASGLTQENYDRIERGAAYEDVCAIFGSDGNKYYESGFSGEETYLAYYTWGTKSSYVQMQFKNGKLIEKAAYNLP